MQPRTLIGVVFAIAFATSVADAQPDKTQAPARTSAKTARGNAGYKKELPGKLVKKAKVAESAAAATALAKVPGGKIEGVELEEEGGKLIYSYDIKVAGKRGIEEIHIDAITGAAIRAEHEDPSTERKEAEDDKKISKKAPAPVKRP